MQAEAFSRRTPRPSRLSRALCPFLALLIGACSSVPIVGKGARTKEEEQARMVRAVLDSYTRDFVNVVTQTALTITDATEDMAARRATVHWQLMTIPRVQELNRKENKLEAFLGLWIYTVAMNRYFLDGDGGERFGEAQPIAHQACEKLTRKMNRVAVEVLGEENAASAHADVEAFLDSHRDFGSLEAAIQEFTASGMTAADWLPSINLSAFNPFGGLNESAEAIRYFTERTNTALADLSQQLPWRVQLLLYDIEERETVRAASASLERVSESAVSLADTAATLTDDVQAVITTTLDEIDAKQAGLRTTLEQVDETVRSFDSSLLQAQQVVAGLTATAEAMTSAGEAWNATFQTLGLGADEQQAGEAQAGGAPPDAADPQGEPAPGQEARPFDILEYRDTVVALGGVAVELRGLVADVGGLAGGGGEDAPLANLDATVQSSLGEAVAQGRSLVDHATRRAIQLVGVMLLAAILYRFVAARIVPRVARA